MSGTQSKIGKVRVPRVQITYDVETGGAEQSKELPLVIGAVGEFAEEDNDLRERSFINIDKDNFNEVMGSLRPCADVIVDSVLPGKEGAMALALTFSSMEDFTPDQVVQNVPELKALLRMRNELSELRNRAASNIQLKERLGAALEQGRRPEGQPGDDGETA
ncbi:MAG: type VI secretion system contractile sheath small subunit [Pseudomonas putida]|jgi:type VI secretion system protein ImpB|nr:type VI secretion system contractile sheath small subunit [Pseudomonas putida]